MAQISTSNSQCIKEANAITTWVGKILSGPIASSSLINAKSTITTNNNKNAFVKQVKEKVLIQVSFP